MTGKVIKARFAGCAVGFLLQIMIAGCLLAGFFSLMVLAALAPLPPQYQDARDLIFLVCLGLFFLAALGTLLFWAFTTIFKRARQLDAAFTPLGLTGGAYLLNGRQYHGTLQGRPVDVYYYRGPALDLYIASPLKTRLGIGRKDRTGEALAQLMKRAPMETEDPEISQLSAFAIDEPWAHDLLADPQAKAAILRLTAESPDGGVFELRQLFIQPEAIQYRLNQTRQRSITPEAARLWLYGLLDLARIAESLPAPKVVVEASSMEQKSRPNRNAFTLPAILIVLAILGIPTLCLLIGLALLSLLDKLG